MVDRQTALARAEALGVPTRRVAHWHYTDLAQLLARPPMPAPPYPPVDFGKAYRLVFTDGRLDTAASDALPDSIARQDFVADDDGDCQYAMRLLNCAHAQDGAHLHLTQSLAQPLLLIANGGASSGEIFLRHKISVAAGVRAQIIECFEPAARLNQYAMLSLAQGAELDYVRVQRGGQCLSALRANLAGDARLTDARFIFGGALARHESEITLTAPAAHADLIGGIWGGGEMHADLTAIIDHAAPDTSSNMRDRGVFDGAAQGVVQGKVIVRPDAQRVDAQQNSAGLLLSEAAAMYAKPELEIFADDVACAHGASIGEPDEDALFYLRARGIAEDEARAVLVTAFMHEAIAAVPHGWRAGLEKLAGAA